jgi:hypothetical protein
VQTLVRLSTRTYTNVLICSFYFKEISTGLSGSAEELLPRDREVVSEVVRIPAASKQVVIAPWLRARHLIG